MKKSSWCIAALALFGLNLAAPAAQAQSDGAVAAAIALYMTPAGSFASVSSAALGANGGTSAGFDYGRYSGSGNRSAYGAHLDWRQFRATVGVATETDLDNIVMAGLAAGWALMSSGPLNVGGEADVGYGRLKEGSYNSKLNGMTAGVRVPFSLSTSTEGTTVMPYLAPGGFWGRLSSGSESESGFRATLNGGVRVAFANGVALDVGAQRIFIDDAETLFGVGLSFSRR